MAGPVGGVDYPRTWAEFAAWFPDEAACGAYLERLRWGDGFICPGCGWDRSWAASRGLGSRVCAHCAKRTSITAGTVFAGTRIPLTQWFAAEERNQGLLDHPYNKQMGDAPNGPYGRWPWRSDRRGPAVEVPRVQS